MSKLHSLGALCRYVKTLKMPKTYLILISFRAVHRSGAVSYSAQQKASAILAA